MKMKMMLAGLALMGATAQAQTLATVSRNGVTYTVEQSQQGPVVTCHGEQQTCQNEQYGLPSWLVEFQDWAAQFGGHYETPVYCGDIDICMNETYKVPHWVERVNQWFADHGFTSGPAIEHNGN